MNELIFVVHESPAGGQTPYYMARIDLSYAGLPGQVEQVWLNELGESSYRLESVPFCAYGLTYGDTVVLDDRGEYLSSVVVASGNRVFRLLLAPTLSDREVSAICEELESVADELGVLYERHGDRFLAFNVERGKEFGAVLQRSMLEKERGFLFHEWGDVKEFSGSLP